MASWLLKTTRQGPTVDSARGWNGDFSVKVLGWLGILGMLVALLPGQVQGDVPPLFIDTGSTNQQASGPEVSMGWNPSLDTNVAGYFVCWGMVSGQCTNFLDTGNVTNATLGGLTTNVSYFFTVVAYDGLGDQAVPSNEIQYMTTNAAVFGALSIMVDLTSQTVVVGSNVLFQIEADGAPPLGYEWLFNGTLLSGSTSNSLLLTGISLAQAGTYQVIVTNSTGSATSSLATLTVLAPPGLISDLTNQSVAAGANVSFEIQASGTGPLSYQWLFNGTALPGPGSNVLTLPKVSAAQAGSYQVVVSNALGTITSSMVTLNVVQPSPLRIDPLVGGSFQLSFTSAPFQNFAVQSSTAPSGPWMALGTVNADSSGLISYVVSATAPVQFYRVVLP